VVAAQHDGHAPGLQLGVHRIVRSLVPGQAFGIVAQALGIARPTRVGRAGQVADVLHVHTESAQRPAQLGHAQRIRTHGGAQAAGAHIGGHADQSHSLFGLQRLLVLRQ